MGEVPTGSLDTGQPPHNALRKGTRRTPLLLQVPPDCGIPRIVQPSQDGQAVLCKASREDQEFGQDVQEERGEFV